MLGNVEAFFAANTIATSLCKLRPGTLKICDSQQKLFCVGFRVCWFASNRQEDVMKRRLIRTVLFSIAGLILATAGLAGAQSAPASSPQQVLDLLAAGAAPKSPSYGLPPSFLAWSGDQQRTVPKQVEGKCVSLWTMMNSGGKVQLLPATQDPQASSTLALDACVASKLPADGPPRKAMLVDVGRILARAKALGSALTLPATLVR
jgi:hypothetical protein